MDDRIPTSEVLAGLRQRSGLVRLCVLTMCADSPAHGYELMARMDPFGVSRTNPAIIYRALRWLERAGLVAPSWDTSTMGPARRVFTLTPAGELLLDVYLNELRDIVRAGTDKMARHLQKWLRRRESDAQAFPHRVTIDVLVHGRTEEAAVLQLGEAFAPGRRVTDAVTSQAFRIETPEAVDAS